MSNLTNTRESIELAKCANLEILAALPLMFACFEVTTATGAPMLRALEVYQSALEALAPETLDRRTLDAMIESHAEIKHSLASLAKRGHIPAAVADMLLRAFDDFAAGLQSLAA